jgi:hypothetical protein
MARDICAKQLVYWAQVQAAGAAFDQQNGPGALTVAVAGTSVYTVTMPANFTVPINRRSIVATSRGSAALVPEISYDEAGSAANTVVIRTWASAAGAVTALATVAFILEIARVEFFIGGGVG